MSYATGLLDVSKRQQKVLVRHEERSQGTPFMLLIFIPYWILHCHPITGLVMGGRRADVVDVTDPFLRLQVRLLSVTLFCQIFYFN
jgi:hypothetical protein